MSCDLPLPSPQGPRRRAPPKDIAKLAEVIGGAMCALAMAHEVGIPIVYGTDLFADMHDHQLEEFIIFSEVQPPTDLIRAATRTAARLLQLEGQVRVSAPGAFADLLVIDGNPLEDPHRGTAQVTSVINLLLHYKPRQYRAASRWLQCRGIMYLCTLVLSSTYA